MKTNKVWFVFLAVFAVVGVAMAQTNSVPGGGLSALPQSTSQYWDLVIAAISPTIVWAVDKLIPRVPRVLLPSITPLVGVGLGLLINKLAGAHMGWFDMAKAGALAVFVRETFNQAVTKNLSSSTAPVAPK